jgi:hypothetical protein
MDLILTIPGIFGLILDVVVFVYFARALPLGALSLPCVSVLTSFLYFYVMPVTSVMAGVASLFGMPLNSLEETHWLSILYVLGVALACGLNAKRLGAGPVSYDEPAMPLNRILLVGLWSLFLLSILALFVLGELNLTRSDDYQFASESASLGFLNLGLTIAQPLTIIYLIRNNFGPKSLTLLAAILYAFSVAGFRFRILILLCAVVIAFALVRKIKIRMGAVLAGALVGMALMNLMGIARHYGEGLDFDQFGSLSIGEALSQFGGEIGIVYVTQHAAANPPDWVWFAPQIVAVTRFIPSFIWPDKPTAAYLAFFSSGFPQERAALASGMAAPQQVEMIYQFGWFGVPLLAFIYFWILTRLNSSVARLGREARIAGLSLIPPFFGYYMQSRGYFFQMSAEAVFTFSPVFILSWFSARSSAPIPRPATSPLLGPSRAPKAAANDSRFSDPPPLRAPRVAAGDLRRVPRSPQPGEATQWPIRDRPIEGPGTLQARDGGKPGK